MRRHKASSPYNFNIEFPMYTKFITHVNNVTLNTSMHQYCVISIAPPTGHRNSDKHPIYMTCIAFFLHIIQDDMQLKGENTLWKHRCKSIIKTQLTTDSFEGNLNPFCFYVDCRDFLSLQRTTFFTPAEKCYNLLSLWISTTRWHYNWGKWVLPYNSHILYMLLYSTHSKTLYPRPRWIVLNLLI